MPLLNCKALRGKKRKKCASKNIGILRREGRPAAQAIAIGLRTAGLARKKS